LAWVHKKAHDDPTLPRPPTSVELLERDDALAELGRHRESARAGAGRLVLVSGEAGVGKTSLLRRFTEDLPTLWGFCEPLRTPRPLGPLVDIGDQLGWDVEEALAGTSRAAVFSRLLRDVGEPAGRVVVVEDVHWADDSTLDLLRYLGRRVALHPVLLLVSHRDDELGARHPLRTTVGDLATAPGFARLTLRPLGSAAVGRLCDGSGLDAQELHRRTGGNPFLVTEVLAAEMLANDDAPEVPVNVRDAVLARCSRLSEAARSALETVAVVGARAPVPLLVTLLPDGGTSLDECVESGVLTGERTTVSFRHELAREAVLASIPAVRRANLHAAVLRAMRAGVGTPSRPAVLVHHAEAAGNDAAVLELAPVAGRHASDAGAHRQAAAHFAAALSRAEVAAPAERAELLEQYATQCAAIDLLAEGVHAREEARRLWQQLADPLRESDNLAHLASLRFNLGDTTGAEEASRRAIELAEPLGPSLVLARACRAQATLRMLQRDVDDAVTWGSRAAELAESLGDDVTLGQALNAMGSAWVMTDVDRGRAALERSRALAVAGGQHAQAANAYANLGSALGEVWEVRAADDVLGAGIAYCGELDLDAQRDYMLAWRAITALRLGRLADAAAMAERALRSTEVGTITRIMGLLALGLMRSRRGDPGAAPALDEALALAERTGTVQRVAPVRAARAEAAWLAGDAVRARQEAAAAYELALAKGHRAFVGELGYWLWRTGEEVALPGWAAPQFGLQVDGQARRAADAWQLLGCPYERLRALADADDEGRLEAVAGFTAMGARPAADLVRRQLRATGVRRIPRGPRETTSENPWGLTARELQVLELVADGLSNAAIAGRLVLSTRTVEHHVSAVLAKLGVTSRGEAAALHRDASGDGRGAAT
jgi:DNA-binding CsgD family transcriptional regulator/tetratricopeptide (TPR) repeat protein